MQERPGQIGNYWLSQRTGSKNWCRTWFDAATRQTNRASLGTTDIQEAKVRLWEWYAKYGDISKQMPQDVVLDLVLTKYWQQHACNITSAESAKVALGYWSDFLQVRQSQRLHRHGNVSLLGGYRREAIPSVATAI